MARPALQTITPNQTAALVVAVGGNKAGILPYPERKAREVSHQKQIKNQNKRKRKAVHAQAHVHATTLIAEERVMPKEVRQTTVQLITQVEGEFRAQGYGVTLSKNTINRYVPLGMVGTFPLARGYEGTMPLHAFKLLVLVVESSQPRCLLPLSSSSPSLQCHHLILRRRWGIHNNNNNKDKNKGDWPQLGSRAVAVEGIDLILFSGEINK